MPSPNDRSSEQQDASSLPAPLTTALGIASAGARGARRLPRTAARVPVTVVSYALIVTDNLRREYDELSSRGQSLLEGLRGRALSLPEEAGASVTSLLDSSRVAVDTAREGVSESLSTAADRVDATAARLAEQRIAEAQQARQDVGAEVEQTRTEAQQATEEAAEKIERAIDAAERATQEVVAAARAAQDDPGTAAAPDGAGTDAPDRAGSAAPGDVQSAVESVTESVGGGTRVPSAEELPLPDFDHMSLAQVRGRLRRLSAEELVLLRDYERGHANRLPIVTMLDNRIAKVASETGG
jgi:hypothetical protein